MLNLHELESQWLRYKIKSFLPHLIIFISLAVIVIILTSIDFEEKTNPIAVKEDLAPADINLSTHTKKSATPLIIQKPLKVPDPAEPQISTPKDPVISKKEESVQTSEEENKLLIKPSLDFIRTMKDNSPNYYNSYVPPKANIQTKKKIVQKIETPKIEEIVLDTQVKEVPKQEIQIQRQNTQDDIQHVIKRFKESNNPALSLFIAKKYYELKNYNQSYNYALLTNQINNDIEESWIIFAKSLYKLDQKEKAIEILKKYISTSHSHRAEMLLENIKSGKIK
ncbi:MAG: CDC27 family protein [Helicobacteraceae bacterium]|nr:CDC27 family protein [Candidatus Sulfurimonas ponti]MBL6973112.1 CDC27 family protein [Sulfurimonas sp.]